MDIENYIDDLSLENGCEYDEAQEFQLLDNLTGDELDVDENDVLTQSSSTDALLHETQHILAETQQELNDIRNQQGLPSLTSDSTTDFFTQLHEQNVQLNADIAEIEAAYSSGDDAWIADVEAKLDQKEQHIEQLEIQNNAYINQQEITREIRNEQDQMRWSDMAMDNRTSQYEEEIAADRSSADAENYAEAGDAAAAAEAAEQVVYHTEQATGYQEQAEQYESWVNEASGTSDDSFF